LYHCVSRVVDGRFIFGRDEKEYFLALVREYETFGELRVLTFCLMDNHFHLLVAVPKRPATLPSAAEVLVRLQALSGHRDLSALRQQLDHFRTHPDVAAEQALLERFYARMWNLSAFLQVIKQRFSQWYNRRTGRKGTLWQERFRSVVVEGQGHALTTMAAYIDLNAVRARLVRDPKDYRWCGYGEAVAGHHRARLGIQALVTALQRGRQESVSKSLEVYRMHLYVAGNEGRETIGEDGQPARGALTREAMVEVLNAKGRLPVGDYLRCRVRYFCDGTVFGTRGFVNEVFRARREHFGAKRRDGARPVRGLAALRLFTLRRLRINVFG
jgi:REP element-mobilizing transposase RayT